MTLDTSKDASEEKGKAKTNKQIERAEENDSNEKIQPPSLNPQLVQVRADKTEVKALTVVCVKTYAILSYRQGSTFPGAYAPRFCCGPLDFSNQGPEIVYIIQVNLDMTDHCMTDFCI